MARISRRTQSAATVSAVVESWLQALQIAGRSPKTLHLYRATLSGFTAAVGDQAVVAVTADTVRTYLAGLGATHKPGSVATRFRILRAFFRWCAREERIDRPPTMSVQPPSAPQREPPGFAADELARLVGVCNPRTATGARDRAMLLLLAGTGLRRAELVGLKRTDIVRAGVMEQYVRVIGKGNKERLVALEPLVRRALTEWLEYRTDDDPHLWLGERGPLAAAGLYEVVRRRAKQAGVAEAHPHRFRNTALANMAAAGMDLAAVQRVAGHQNLTQTQRYIAYNESRRANDRLVELAPLSRIDWTAGRKKRGK